jgi:Na+/H+ antiporter NhaD/arsenite permease-like protein
MRRWLLNIAKNETILIVATMLALISCFIVPPDADYKGYIHAGTISQLVCLMLVVCGFQRIGVFRIIGSRLLERVSTMRGLVLTLVALTFFSAMLITNDVALVTFVPFAVAVLIMAGQGDATIFVVTLMTIGANVGSMLTPIGNAHNLYLKSLTGMPTLEFIGIMAPYSAVAALLLVVVTTMAFGRQEVGALGDLETGVLAPERGKHQPDEIRITGYGAGYGGWRTVAYMLLFGVCLLAVSDVIPLWAMCVIVVGVFLITDRRVFRYVDWGLPLTFCMFFIFIGNMKRVPEFYALAGSLVGGHPLEVAVASSQVISNVPTTILLSGFCDQWRDLIIGTNLGGMGTLIASMASLISYKNVVRQYPDRKGRYLAIYSAVNVLFLVVLVGLSWIIE